MGWSLALGAPGVGPSTDLGDADSWRATFRRTAGAEASFTLDGRSPQAASIDELATDLMVSWAGEEISRQRVGPTQDSGDADSVTTEVSCADLRTLLGRRIVWETWTPLARSQDPAQTLWQLIDATQHEPGGDLHITRGSWATMPSAAVVLEPGRSILDTAGTLSSAGGGFDWDVIPGPFSSIFSVWPGARGRDTNLVLDYGGVVETFSRQVATDTFADSVRLSGGTASDGTTVIPAARRDAADIATRPEGRWEFADSGSGLDDATTVGSVATARLSERQLVTPSWTGRLADGWWTGPSQLWLGDRVLWVCREGRLNVVEMLPVEEITVTGGADIATPTIDVTVGAPRPGRNQRPAALDRRLSTLEQR